MKRFLLAIGISCLFFGAYKVASYKPSLRQFPSEQAAFKIVTVAANFNHPWSVGFLPTGEFMITERAGKLWVVSADGSQRREITGLPPIYNEGQGGLLDILVPPDFKDRDWIYFTYAAPDTQNAALGGTQAARARLNLRQNRLTELQVLFTALPKIESGHHFGSRLVLDGDDLYISLGERGEMENSQNTSNHLGSIIRIHKDGSIPSDNPFTGNPDIPDEIFAYGIRNSQGLTQNPDTGKIWETEHGPQGGDELNILKGGVNYGWPIVTLGANYVTGTKISDHKTLPNMEDSIWHWTPSIAPSGMAFYTGDKIPQWKGNLFVGALAHRKLIRLTVDGDKITHEEILLESFGKRIRDVRNAPDGFLYILTDESNGELARLVPMVTP